MLEHIFRNINDIRVFDVLDMMNVIDKEYTVDIDDILDVLDYGESERIQIEDSIEHLIKSKILEIVEEEVTGWTGCRTCLYTDKLKLPRLGEHKKHKPYEVSKGNIDKYYIVDNDVTWALKTAVFKNVMMTS